MTHCPACNVLLSDHLGLVGTCRRLQEEPKAAVREAFKRLEQWMTDQPHLMTKGDVYDKMELILADLFPTTDARHSNT